MSPKSTKVTKKAPKPVKPAESDEESSSESEEEMQVEVAPKKNKKQPVKVPAKRKKDESSSDSEESDDSEEAVAAPPQKVAKTVPKAATKKVKQESSEDSSSSSEEETPPPPKVAKKAAKAPKKPEDSDDSSEEEETPPAKTKTAKLTKAAAKKVEEDSDSDSEEEEAPAAKPAKKKAAKTAPKKEDSDDSSEEEDSEEEEETPSTKPAKTEKAAKAQVKDEESSDEESSDEESSEEETPPAKKKAGKPVKDDEEEKSSKAKINGSAAKKNKSEKSAEGEVVTIMCRNVPMETTIANLEKFFTKKGIEVTEIRKRDNKMFAHVDLKNPDDLDKVMEMNGIEFKGSELNFEKALPFGTPKPDRKMSSGNADDNAVMFVKNIPNAATEDEIRQKLTEMFTGVKSVRIPMKDDYHKGFAYVQFNDAANVKEAIDNHQGIDYDGRPLYLDYSSGGPQKRGPRNSYGGDTGEKSNVLFVKNLSYDSTESSLKDVFSEAMEVRLPRQPDSGRPKGFAFIEFDSVKKAEEAFNNYNQSEVDGRLVYICYSNAGKGRDGRSGGGKFGRGGGGGGFGRGGGGRGRGGGFGRGGFGRGGSNRGRSGGFTIDTGSSRRKKTFDSDSD